MVGTGLIPGRGTIPHGTWCGQKKKKKTLHTQKNPGPDDLDGNFHQTFKKEYQFFTNTQSQPEFHRASLQKLTS